MLADIGTIRMRRNQSDCHTCYRAGCHRGVTLIECLILVVILGIVGVAAAVGLASVSKAPGGLEDALWDSQQIISKIENLRDTTYGSLVSGTSTSDADYRNTTYTVSWTVTEIDPASPTANPPVVKANSGLKQLTVSMNGRSLTTWVSQ
jgi:Tfp pilus assembly protein FimT